VSVEQPSKLVSGKLPLQKIVLGTRGSELALAQARMVAQALERAWPSLNVAIEIIRTLGDEKAIPIKNASPARTDESRPESTKVTSGSLDSGRGERKAGRKGIFTAELEGALVGKRIDVAVHSAKDLASESDPALTITAVLPRGAVEDLLLRRSAIPAPATIIATGSVRRQRQVLWTDPSARVIPLRGNVPTRLRKFIQSNWDGIILARAGLERLGFSASQFEFEGQKMFAEILPLEKFVPAGGQGVVALQTRTSDSWVREMVSAIDHHETHLCLRTEREFLRRLHGNCDLPVGAHARVVNAEIELRVQLFGDAAVPKMASGYGKDPEQLATEMFQKLEHE
jgi:hydroxymethylbilane synthase